jgi:uncharacterized protein (TIGR03083 family)
MIHTLPLFPLLNEQLISFLQQLSTDDWQRQTVARKWVVKDVVAHLLDGNFRRIALHRDGWSAPPDRAIQSSQELIDYLNQLNADWVKATKRLSPAILTELLATTNKEVVALFNKLDPMGQAVYPVSWAGETVSYNWFDIAREYTERWLHQQQIRDAVGNDELLTEKFYHPALNIFMQAWPYTLNDTAVVKDTVIKVTITGSGAGSWFAKKEQQEWVLIDQYDATVAAETIIDGKEAWKLFSKSVRAADIRTSIKIKGDEELGAKILNMVSVMA